MEKLEYDAYAIEEQSDEDCANSSSEDELDVLLCGTPDQKLKFVRECLTGECEPSSDDEFEKEMGNELSSTMEIIEGSWNPVETGPSTSTATVAMDMKQQQYYDVHFDSDSEDEVKQDKKPRLKVQTNDDLLYDPLEDDRNQRWVDGQRKRHRNMKNNVHTLTKPNKLSCVCNSDAILNCPACMTTLCLDCQRHDVYTTQYRAMFVLNCTIDRKEVLRFPEQPSTCRKSYKKKMITVVKDCASESLEMYHSVICSECSTQVGVFDKDEVYHFFNVLASHC